MTQKRVNDFMKQVHPDLFSQAPEEVLTSNAESVQRLNEIVSNLKNVTDRKGIPETSLKFYIRQGEQFVPLEYEVAGLRDNCEPDMKQRHLSMIADGLSETLDKAMDSEEVRQKDDDFYDDLDPKGYQFRLQSQRWEDNVRRPVKWSKQMEYLTEEVRMRNLDNKVGANVHRGLNEQVLRNVYRSFYDIPNDRAVRQADPLMKTVVGTSEALM